MATLDFLPNRARWRVRWHATNRSTGAVFTGSRCLSDKPAAARLWAEMEAAEAAFRTSDTRPGESIAAAAEQFATHCRLRHTPRTCTLYAAMMARFLAHLSGVAACVHQIRPATIEDYLASLQATGLSNRSLNIHLTVIKSFCRFTAKRAHIANPAAEVAMLREDPPRQRFLTPDEYATLLEHADAIQRPRLIFLANTGLRASEFCQAVNSGKLTPAAQSITIDGKGRRRRTVPLNAPAREAIARGLKPCRQRNALYEAFAKLAKKANIPPLGPHALRHYFATQLLLKGVPLAVVAKLCGHSVRVCETIYSHILPQDVQDSTSVLDFAQPL